jgi:hypothetical protein
MISKLFFTTVVFFASFFSCHAFGFNDSLLTTTLSYPGHHNSGGINIFVISKDKYFDNISRVITLQARFAGWMHHRKLKIIMAHSTNDAASKIAAIVDKCHCTIDNLWFDSHGKYRKRYSSFIIGSNEYSYKNITDTNQCQDLKKIASYCDQFTNIGIGACYAAATFNFPLPDSIHMNMQGDSLLNGIGHIFKGSFVYGSESWVMAKPGMFGIRNALAGYPLGKEYKDILFKPVWDRLGMWRRYNPAKFEVEDINTVYLSGKAGIVVEKNSYLTSKRAQRKQLRHLKKLVPGRYKLSE